MKVLRWVAVVAFAASTALVAPAVGSAAAPASGPPLSVATSSLNKALTCHGDLGAAGTTPVLLVPGTTVTPKVNYSWNYEKAFTAASRPWCAVTIPNHGMSDIQISAEYIVHAIRTMHRRAGHKISILGYSQGGMSPRWALKWWPDTRAMVDDVVSLDGSNHGTLDAVPLCLIGCAPSLWQQSTKSAFLTALNAGKETYRGISYTQIYSLTDEVATPNFGPKATSRLHTGPGRIANIPVQSICPLEIAEHVSMGTTDPVGYALAIDALDHRGPAVRSRISKAVCRQVIMPAVNPWTLLSNETRFLAQAGRQILTYPHVGKEPALAGYAS